MAGLTDDTRALLESLRNRIAAKLITQSQLAAATGVHQSQISRILAGRVSRVSTNLKKLCKYAESLSGVPKPQHAENDIFETLDRLVGHNRQEEVALAKLLYCLADWRATWAQQR